MTFPRLALPALRLGAALALSAVLSACGGGGNELGPTDMSLLASPDAVSVGDIGVCASGVGPTVHVYGGTPPYVLKNSAPLAMALDHVKIAASGDGFTLTFNGTCLVSMPITIEDVEGRLLEVPITNQPL